jgi:YD repeat-containing protein
VKQDCERMRTMAMKKMMMVIAIALFLTGPFLPDSHALEITYTYDNLNRITAAKYLQDSKTTMLSYQYDAAGNRTAYTVTGAVLGDIDNDGNVTIADAILVCRVMSGMPITGLAIASAIDVNSDGKIGLVEAIYILQKVAGMR